MVNRGGVIVDFDAALVLLDNVATKSEADTLALWLSGKQGDKDVVQVGEAVSIVDDVDQVLVFYSYKLQADQVRICLDGVFT